MVPYFLEYSFVGFCHANPVVFYSTLEPVVEGLAPNQEPGMVSHLRPGYHQRRSPRSNGLDADLCTSAKPSRRLLGYYRVSSCTIQTTDIPKCISSFFDICVSAPLISRAGWLVRSVSVVGAYCSSPPSLEGLRVRLRLSGGAIL